MKSIKAIVAVSMAAALTLSFCGCGTERNRNREASSVVFSETESKYVDEVQSESENKEYLTSSEDGEKVNTEVDESIEEQSDETEYE